MDWRSWGTSGSPPVSIACATACSRPARSGRLASAASRSSGELISTPLAANSARISRSSGGIWLAASAMANASSGVRPAASICANVSGGSVFSAKARAMPALRQRFSRARCSSNMRTP